MATRSREKSLKRKQNADLRPTAHAKYLRVSPFKVRQVLDLIRGKDYTEAQAILMNTPRAASGLVLKVLNSAAANGEHNRSLNKADLFVAEAFADGGPILKRMHPRARGGAAGILKRTSHITVILDTKA
jgi:large subunit ribosomal protein L22